MRLMTSQSWLMRKHGVRALQTLGSSSALYPLSTACILPACILPSLCEIVLYGTVLGVRLLLPHQHGGGACAPSGCGRLWSHLRIHLQQYRGRYINTGGGTS